MAMPALPAVAEPVVQPLPGGDSRALNAALARLAANPRDVGALVDAGNAALAVNDVDAAIGFYTRAGQIAPSEPRAKAGLAGAYVRSEDPYTAIRLFNEAERVGPLPGSVLADRGLAYDLVGDNATAQRFYRQASAFDDEAVRRLALSLAISGDRRGSEAALNPQLVQQNKSAWRTRVFALAILGDEAQAVSVAKSTMPAGLAAQIAPYLRYMRQLTRAQQAAAANLGHFPRASEIGRDDPRMAQYAPSTPRRAAGGADAGLIPSGQALGTTRARGGQQAARPSRQDRRTQERQAREAREREAQERARLARQDQERNRVRPPEPVVAVSTATPSPSSLASAPSPRPAALPRPAPAPPPPPPPTASAPTPSLAVVGPPAGPRPLIGPPADPARAPTGPAVSTAVSTITETIPLAEAPASAAVTAPTPAPVPPRPPVRPRLADAFGDFTLSNAAAVPAAGAVDIRRIVPSRPPEVKLAEAKPAKPAPPAQPSRIWVQVATGRDKAALGFDWRRMAKGAATVFRGKKPYVAAWGQTNRMLTGPFESEAAASDFITQLRRADIDGPFLWTSPAGQVVDDLVAAK